MILRRVLALMVMSLMAVPGWAAPGASVGTVQGSHDAIVRGTTLVPGTTVYSGDRINVGAHGSAWISLPRGGQVILSSNSQASLERAGTAEPVRLVMEKGYGKFRPGANGPLEAILGDATIRTADATGVGYINVVNGNSALIGAEKGNVVVTTPTGSTTVPEGMALTVRMDGTQTQSSGNASGSGMTTSTKIIVGALIIGAATGIAAGVALNESGTSQRIESPFTVQ